MYHDTPPICIAILFQKYQGQGSLEHSLKTPPGIVRKVPPYFANRFSRIGHFWFGLPGIFHQNSTAKFTIKLHYEVLGCGGHPRNYFRHFSTTFAQGKKKRQKSPNTLSLKNLFDNFRAAPVFRPLLSESGRFDLGKPPLKLSEKYPHILRTGSRESAIFGLLRIVR